MSPRGLRYGPIRSFLQVAGALLVALAVQGCGGSPGAEPGGAAAFPGRLLLAWESRMYELEQGMQEPRELFELPRGVRILRASPDAELAVAWPRDLVNLRTGEVRQLPVPKPDADAAGVSIAFSPGNRYLGYALNGPGDPRAWIVDLKTWKAIRVFEAPCALYLPGGEGCGEIADLAWIGRDALAVAAYASAMPGSLESYDGHVSSPSAETLLLFGTDGNELRRFERDEWSREARGRRIWSLESGGPRLLAGLGKTLGWIRSSDLLAGRFLFHELVSKDPDDRFDLSGSLAPDGLSVVYEVPSSGAWMFQDLQSGAQRRLAGSGWLGGDECFWAPDRTSLACQGSSAEVEDVHLVPFSGDATTTVLSWSEYWEGEEVPPRDERDWGDGPVGAAPQLVAWAE